MIEIKKYNTDDFPNSNIDPSLKVKKEYCLSVSKTIYAYHSNGKTGIPVSLNNEFKENRIYGAGKQSVDKYKTVLSIDSSNSTTTPINDIDGNPNGVTGKTGDREGYMSLLWQIISVTPKFKDTIHSLFDKNEQDVIATAIDQTSLDKKLYAKYRLLVESRYKDWIQSRTEIAGIDYISPDFEPQNMDELNLYELSGGIILPIEEYIEKLIKHTFEISNWDEIKQSIIDDSIDLGIIAIRAYYDPETKKIKGRYVNPSPDSFGLQWSEHWNFHDSEYAFEIKSWSLSKIKQELYKEGYSEYEINKILRTCAKKYSGKLGNPIYNDSANYVSNIDGSWIWDSWKVDVMEVVWKEVDIYKKYYVTNDYGKTSIYDLKYDPISRKYLNNNGKESINDEKRKIEDVPLRRIYKSNLIIDTDIIFDYGLDTDIIIKGNEPILPYIVFKLRTIPITRRIIPFIDQICLSWFKVQNALAMAKQNILALNPQALNINLATGEKLGMYENIKMGLETGFLLMNFTKANGDTGNYQLPIFQVQGGAGPILKEQIEMMEWCANKIEYYTGINPLITGVSPDPDQGKAVSQMAIGQSGNVLRPIFDACMKIKSDFSEYSAEAIKHLIRSNKDAENSYRDIIGDNGIELMKMAIKSNVQYGIKLETRPTDQMERDVHEYITIAQTIGRDGIASIDIDDAIRIRMMLENGSNLKFIMWYIAFTIKKKREQRQKEAQQASMQTHQQNMEFDAIKIQNQNTINKNKFEADLYLQNNGIKGNIEEIKAQAMADKNIAYLENIIAQYNNELNKQDEAENQNTTTNNAEIGQPV